MNPAEKVISKFGGQTALARLIEKGQSTVQHWAKVGMIPARWQSKLLEIARENGIDLYSGDFMQDVLEPEVEIVSHIPEAKWSGELIIGEMKLPCYVLEDGRRIISRTGATTFLTDKKGGGNLEQYIRIKPLQPYLQEDWSDKMIEFSLPEIVNKKVLGMDAETFLEICRAYIRARDAGTLSTQSQMTIAIKAGMLLSACAKIGLIALIDEATGYQYERAQDALRFKLELFLEDEMRKWERTFPEELWKEFGRLTNWQGSVHSRPKYWGKLVMELIYNYLDRDVVEWLKNNAPKPRHGQNYHQWLSSQYGLKKLIEHIWMVVGMAKACSTMQELRYKMAEQFGYEPLQLILYLPPIGRLPYNTYPKIKKTNPAKNQVLEVGK
jgi:hypothetical protein